MKKGKTGGISKQHVILIAISVALVGMSGGLVLAAGLTSTTVTQTAGLYSVTTTAVAAFPTPGTVTVTAIPAAVAACTAASLTLANSVVVNLYLPASAGVTCTTGDFAEELSFTSLATAAAGIYAFTQYTTYGAGPTSGSAMASVTVAAVMSIPGVVNVYIDYGTASPPVNGISALSLVVQ
jgi:hypothetical protein